MSISDAQYLAWLGNDNQRRVILVEAVAYSGGSEVTRYLATSAYVSTPADSPANTAYDDIITSVPQFARSMSEAFTGQSTMSWGDVEIINEGGARDSWLLDAWDGRSLRMYLGAPGWPKSDFRLILDGASADIVAKDSTHLALRIRDKQALLNVPIQASLLGGSTANANQPIPLCYGECFNVEPLLTDGGTHTYQVHDGAINDITDVRDNGISLGAGYTKDLANGKFTLTNAPAGRITADVQGAKPSGTYLTKVADIVNHIATTRAGLTAGDIDSANFSAFATTCPQPVGLYVRSRANLIEALDQLLASVGGWYGFSRSGKLQLGRLEAPSGTPVLDLCVDDIVERRLAVKRRQIPLATVRLGYKRNWTPQSDGLAGAVTESNRALYAAEHQAVSSTDASIKTAHKLAQEPDLAPSLLVAQADASTEAARRRTLYGSIRIVYQADTFTAPFQVNVGDVVRLTHPRFGFSAGALARVVAITEQPSKNRATLELWR